MTRFSADPVAPVLVFDVMGTVVDIDGSVARDAQRVLAPLGFDDTAVAELVGSAGAELQQSMTAIVNRDLPWQGHRALRLHAWQRVAPQLPAEVRTVLASVVERADPWPDSPAALTRLRAHCTVAALSNADPDEMAAMSEHGALTWDVMLSAHAVHSFKPDPAVYLMAAEQLGRAPDQLTMVAAHPWDLRAAAALGLRTAYVRRPDAEPPAPGDSFDVEVDDLAALADLFDAESTDQQPG